VAEPGEDTPIPPAVDAADLDRFVAAVGAHPDVKEVLRRRALVQGDLATLGGSDLQEWSWRYHCADHDRRRQRNLLYVDICDRLLRGGVRVSQGRPTAVITLGPPGAGKTSVARPFAEQTLGIQMASINPDDVRERLPEYEGWNSEPLHAEASYVAKHMLREQVHAGQYNAVHDIVGSDGQAVVTLVREMTVRHGYDVYVVLADLPAHVAAGRAWQRFQANPFQRRPGPPGRFVPLEYVQFVGDKPSRSFDLLKGCDEVVGYCRLDMTRSAPGRPVVVEHRSWPGIRPVVGSG